MAVMLGEAPAKEPQGGTEAQERAGYIPGVLEVPGRFVGYGWRLKTSEIRG
jgi:hypothetical protein